MEIQKQILGFFFITCAIVMGVLAILVVLDVVALNEFLTSSTKLLEVAGIVLLVSVVVGVVVKVLGSKH